jgi:hypothetical protein
MGRNEATDVYSKATELSANFLSFARRQLRLAVSLGNLLDETEFTACHSGADPNLLSPERSAQYAPV